MEKIQKYTNRTVNKAVKLYFRNNGISYKEAAQRLGYANVNTVDNMLSYGKFGKRVALKWAREFGFNEEYLMTGKGRLMERRSGYQKLVQENEQLRAIVRSQKAVIESQKAELTRLKEQESPAMDRKRKTGEAVC